MSAKTDNFINSNKWGAVFQGTSHGIPPSIILAQSILESGWGESGLSVNANNYFGIKADSSWKGEVYNADTHEYYNGQLTFTNADFRAYKTPYGSFKDHSNFLKENPRYSELFKLSKTDYQGWAKGLKAAGYATSLTYDDKIINLVEQYQLNKFDKLPALIKVLSFVTGLLIVYLVLKYIVKIKFLNKK